jgi:threonine/homoserine/homoserine lactone efflux protein
VLLAYLALSIVVICTPGPDTALTIRNALLAGRAGGAWTAAGVASGQAVWTVAASLGAASLLRASQPAFLALKLIGVAYLLYLGVHALRSALKRQPAAALVSRSGKRPARWRAYRQGLINDLANPKMAAFFVSMLPQFVPVGIGHAAALGAFLGLGFMFSGITLVWLVGYSMVVAGGRRLLDRPRVRRGIDAIAGLALIGFGVRLALADPTR